MQSGNLNEVDTNAPLLADALPIPGFPRYYLTRRGEVYSQRVERWLKPGLMAKSYFGLTLVAEDGTRQRLCLPQVVGELFVPNPGGLRYAIPRNSNPRHFHADNLVWATSFSPPTPPVSVAPGQHRRATTLAQLVKLWQRFEESQAQRASLFITSPSTANCHCKLITPKGHTLWVHLRSKIAVGQLVAMLNAFGQQHLVPDPAKEKPAGSYQRSQFEQGLFK